MISVIMPVYNGARFLGESLTSIEEQGHDDLELLLIDDGSTDDLAAHCVNLPPWVRCLHQPNRGPAAARNLGLEGSKGELVAFLDVDDRWTPGHLDRLEGTLQEHPEAGIAQGRMQQFAFTEDGSEERSGTYRMPYLGSCLFRRRVFEQCGVLDVSMRFGEDYDLMVRCWENDILKWQVPEVSLLYRRHPGNMTRGNDNLAHVVVLKKRLERIRTGLVDPAAERKAVFQEYIGDVEGAAEWTRWSA